MLVHLGFIDAMNRIVYTQIDGVRVSVCVCFTLHPQFYVEGLSTLSVNLSYLDALQFLSCLDAHAD